jgi:GT2 family glycosyltransferase
MDVSIIYPNWNTTDFLKVSIARIMEAKPKCSFEIIVVDNGSKDYSLTPYVVENLEEVFYKNHVRWIWNDFNVGPAFAWNQGIIVSRGRHVCLMSTDVMPQIGFLDHMYEYLEDHPDVGLVAPAATNTCRPEQSPEISTGRIIEVKEVIPFICVMIPKRVILKVGFLHMGNNGFEDTDYCNRIMEAGYKMVVVGTSFVHHLWHKAYQNNNLEADDTETMIRFYDDVLIKRFLGEIE